MIRSISSPSRGSLKLAAGLHELGHDLESVTRAAMAMERVGSLAERAHESLRSLEPILRSGPAEERAAAIRRCVERAVVEFDAKRVKVIVRVLPMDAEGPLAMGVEEVEARLDAR